MSIKTVNTLKCVNCNIVISELLSFIQNKITVIDNESLIRICASAFSEEEVEYAKDLLFSSIKNNQKKVSRRKEGKKQRNLEDMISVFKVTEPDLMPVFVARDLQKLPPVTFDHVDVTKLLKDLLIMRNEISDIKNNYATVNQLDELKREVESSRSAASFLTGNINMKKRGGYMLDSGPVGLPPVGHNALPRHSNSQHNESSKYRSLARANEAEKSSEAALINSTLLDNEMCAALSESPACHISKSEAKQPTMAQIVSNGVWRTQDKPNDEWIIVQKRRYRNRFAGKTGKAVTDLSEKFKAADIKIPLFISNVNKMTAEKDICEYIKNKTSETVSLEKISMKKERPYNAFKLYINKNKLDIFLDDQIWPDGIKFRRYIHFRNKVRDGNNLFQRGNITKILKNG